MFQDYTSLLSTRLIRQERGWSRRLSWWSWNRGRCHPAFVAFHLSHCWTVDICGRTAPRYEGHLDGWCPQTPTGCKRILVWGPRPGLPTTSRPNLWDYLVAEGDDGPLRSPACDGGRSRHPSDCQAAAWHGRTSYCVRTRACRTYEVACWRCLQIWRSRGEHHQELSWYLCSLSSTVRVEICGHGIVRA